MADDAMIRLVILHPSGPADAEMRDRLVASPSSAPLTAAEISVAQQVPRARPHVSARP
jgi:hypothetical protein